MKCKLIYKNGVRYEELPDNWYNRDRIYLPKRNIPTVVESFQDFLQQQQEDAFNHVSFERINGELHKVLQEI